MLVLSACGTGTNTSSNTSEDATASESSETGVSESTASSENTTLTENTLVYGSADYTRINPAMDEHGEINTLLFDGLTAHDANGQVVPGLAESWDYDENTFTYTFHIREGIRWHDGENMTADDVKFTFEAIMNPENGSENAPCAMI